MRYDKWTVALAAAGAISLASAAKAEEKPTPVLTSLSATTLSGYVDTSAQWNLGTGNAFTPPYRFGGSSKADGFNLNVVQVRLEKPLDETEWAAGYRFDLWAGPDANVLGTQSLTSGASDVAIRQAYLSLRVPVYNGLDFKMGVFDSIIGYESVESYQNPNYTRSYGHTIEPQTHTGVLASYRFCNEFSASFGVADTMGPSINSRAQDGSTGIVGGLFGNFGGAASPFAVAGDNAKAESYKTYMGSIVLRAPESMGFLAGSYLYGGLVSGFDNSALGTGVGVPQFNAYAGATLATPLKNLTLGFAFDKLSVDTRFYAKDLFVAVPDGAILSDARVDAAVWTLAAYASLQATPKLSFHTRVEYLDAQLDSLLINPPGPAPVALVDAHLNLLATTVTAQYDLWKNVVSRAEFRWDHCLNGRDFFGQSNVTPGASPFEPGNSDNAFMLALNLIYKF
jgi:hypothetical protein